VHLRARAVCGVFTSAVREELRDHSDQLTAYCQIGSSCSTRQCEWRWSILGKSPDALAHYDAANFRNNYGPRLADYCLFVVLTDNLISP